MRAHVWYLWRFQLELKLALRDTKCIMLGLDV